MLDLCYVTQHPAYALEVVQHMELTGIQGSPKLYEAPTLIHLHLDLHNPYSHILQLCFRVLFPLSSPFCPAESDEALHGAGPSGWLNDPSDGSPHLHCWQAHVSYLPPGRQFPDCRTPYPPSILLPTILVDLSVPLSILRRPFLSWASLI